jgi:iron complex outermembrane receptor protein
VASGQYTPGVAPANPEKLYSYEVGLKAGSNGYRANIAAFYYDYSDLQVETLTNGGVTTVPENAAKARIYGIDFDASAVVVPGLQLKLNATWLPEAKYTAFPNAIVYVAPMTPNGEATNYNYDASGSRMLNAPRISGTLSADYTTTTQAGGWDLNASIYHSSSYRWVYTGTVQTGQYSLVGARLTFTPASTGLKLSIYGKNLTNAAYFDGMTPNPDASVGFYGQPREVGISGEYSF